MGQKDSLGVTSKKKQYICRHCPNRRGGGQPHVKKLKRNDFLTKVGEGGGHKTYCQKLKHSILYDLSLCLYPCTLEALYFV